MGSQFSFEIVILKHRNSENPAFTNFPGPPGSEWSQRLNADKAGMAGNAEDFTKEFMKQLTGQ